MLKFNVSDFVMKLNTFMSGRDTLIKELLQEYECHPTNDLYTEVEILLPRTAQLELLEMVEKDKDSFAHLPFHIETGLAMGSVIGMMILTHRDGPHKKDLIDRLSKSDVPLTMESTGEHVAELTLICRRIASRYFNNDLSILQVAGMCMVPPLTYNESTTNYLRALSLLCSLDAQLRHAGIGKLVREPGEVASIVPLDQSGAEIFSGEPLHER